MNGRQLPLGLDPRPRASFESYWPGPNALALEALREAAASPAGRWIALSGPAGTGKSHLLGAVARGAGQFLAGRRLRAAATPASLEEICNYSMICIDDLDELIGSEAWEGALFRLLNRQRQLGQGLVFSCRAGPRQQQTVIPDLASRLRWGLHLRLRPLDDGGKARLLTARAQAMGLELDARTVRYMLARLPRDVGALLGWLERLAAASLALQRRPSARLLGELLETEAES